MKKTILLTVFKTVMIFLLCACGSDESLQDNPNASTTSETTANTATTTVDNVRGNPAEISITGSVRFSINNATIELSHIPAGRAFYTMMASQVTFHASDGSQESLMLNIMGADLKALDYPVTLPRERDPNEPLTMANRGATVGWAYMDADGVEWTTGNAKVQLVSLSRDGVLSGRFGETPLRSAGQEDIVLDNGEFTVQLTSPW